MDESGQNPVILPPQVIEKPTSVTVFGVLNIVFGVMGLLCSPFGVFGLFMAGEALPMAPAYRTFLLVSYLVGFGFSIWLLVLGVGLLKLRGWARRGSVIYAVVAIVWGVFGMGMNMLALSLGWLGTPEGGLPGVLGGICGGLVGLIYPVLLLIFMNTARVKQAFGATVQKGMQDAASVLRPQG